MSQEPKELTPEERKEKENVFYASQFALFVDYFGLLTFGIEDVREFCDQQVMKRRFNQYDDSKSWQVQARLWLANKYPEKIIWNGKTLHELNEEIIAEEREKIKQYLDEKIKRDECLIDFLPMP